MRIPVRMPVRCNALPVRMPVGCTALSVATLPPAMLPPATLYAGRMVVAADLRVPVSAAVADM